jgi:hypothetical protein
MKLRERGCTTLATRIRERACRKEQPPWQPRPQIRKGWTLSSFISCCSILAIHLTNNFCSSFVNVKASRASTLRGSMWSGWFVSPKNKQLDYNTYEEKDKRALEWLVRTSSHLIGSAGTNPNKTADDDHDSKGKMTKREIHRAKLLMEAWSRRAPLKGSKAPHVVEHILKRLVQERDAGNHEVLIDTKLYNILLQAWSQSKEKGSAERCEEIVIQMECMELKDHVDVTPNIDSYNSVIKAYVQNGSRQSAVLKAQAVIDRMLQSNSLAPNRRSYNLLLYAICNSCSQQKDQGIRCEKVLRTMLEVYANGQGNVNVKPDINTYNQVIGAWVRSCQPGFEKRMNCIFEQILAAQDAGICPNTDTFNALMGGYLKSYLPDALERFAETIKSMQDDFAAGNPSARPDRVTMNTIAAACAKHRDATGDAVSRLMQIHSNMETKYRLYPDTISHNIAIDALSKSGRPDAPELAVDLLNMMEERFKKGAVQSKPDAYTYSSVIDCFVKCSRLDAADSTEKVQKVLRQMEDLYRNHGGDRVDTSVYNTLLNAHLILDSVNAAEWARGLLRHMEENHDADPCIPKPDRITYNTVMKAMRGGTTQQASYAENLLRSMEELGRENEEFLPDSYSYTSVISAYGRSKADFKADKALGLLKGSLVSFENGNIAARPHVQTFNAALNACAFVEGNWTLKSESFSNSMSIWDLLCEHSEPDQTSYGTVLRACASLLSTTDPRRKEKVDYFFQEAASHGQVGKLVLKQLKFAALPSQHLRLTGRDITDRVSLKDLPRGWTQNVPENVRNQRNRYVET